MRIQSESVSRGWFRYWKNQNQKAELSAEKRTGRGETEELEESSVQLHQTKVRQQKDLLGVSKAG